MCPDTLKSSLSWFLGAVVSLIALSASSQQAHPITIETKPPGAVVYLDDEASGSIGVTPLKANIKEGPHTLIIDSSSYGKLRKVLVIDGTCDQAIFSYQLAELNANLSVEGTTNAQIYLDGVPIGKVPSVRIGNSPGKHYLKVTKYGFETFEQWVDLPEKSTKTISAVLLPSANFPYVAEPSKPLSYKKIASTLRSNPIYLLNQGVCCSRSSRESSAELFGVWGEAKGGLVIAVGEDGLIERSENNGALWRPKDSQTNKKLNSVWGSTANDIYAVGEDGTILRSTDRGSSWNALSTGVSDTLYSIWGSSTNNIYAVGEDGLIVCSTDQGKTWKPQENENLESLYGVFGRSASEIYAVGEYGKILRLKDNKWLSLKSDTSKDLYAIWGAPSGALIAVGQDGTILRSADGASWYQQKSGTNAALYTVWGTPSGEIYVAGDTLLKSTDGGLSWSEVSSKIPLRSLWGSSAGSLVMVGK